METNATKLLEHSFCADVNFRGSWDSVFYALCNGTEKTEFKDQEVCPNTPTSI